MLVEITSGLYKGQQILLESVTIKNTHSTPPVSASATPIIYMGDKPLLQFLLK